MTRRIVAAAFMMTMAIGSAGATESIDCNDPQGRASVGLTVGSLPVLAVVGAHISVGHQEWAIGMDGDKAIISGQAFQTGDQWLVDFTDPNVERVIAEVRLLSALENDEYVLAGTLKVPGVGAYPLVCVGP